jgi:hypothetical protein
VSVWVAARLPSMPVMFRVHDVPVPINAGSSPEALV